MASDPQTEPEEITADAGILPAHLQRVAMPSPSIRTWALFAATLAWLWASSVFTPWAEDRLPRLWLFDTLFYARHALMFWAATETALLIVRRRERRARLALGPLVGIAVAVLGSWVYQHTEVGLRWRIAASSDALVGATRVGNSDVRQRAGHFLLDSVREPCPGQAWLWLGRPYGGGTGTNIALVHAEGRPLTPSTQAFAFWRAGRGWWVAYQHAARYQSLTAQPTDPSCRPGRVLARHGAGNAWVDAGRRALHGE